MFYYSQIITVDGKPNLSFFMPHARHASVHAMTKTIGAMW